MRQRVWTIVIEGIIGPQFPESCPAGNACTSMGSRRRHGELPDLYRLTRSALMAHDSAKILPFGTPSKRWLSVVGILLVFLFGHLTSTVFRRSRDWSRRVDRYQCFHLWCRLGPDRNERRYRNEFPWFDHRVSHRHVSAQVGRLAELRDLQEKFTYCSHRRRCHWRRCGNRHRRRHYWTSLAAETFDAAPRPIHERCCIPAALRLAKADVGGRDYCAVVNG